VSEPDRFAAERELCGSVAAGDRKQAEVLARRLLPYVRRVTHSLLGSTTDAEDATQAALVEILQSARSYTGRGSLEAWAHRIAARVALRGARRARALRIVELTEDQEPVDYSGVFDHQAPVESVPRPLDEYLAELSDVQRDAVVLRHGLGHTVPEISEMTNAPIPTVKSRILKAQQELRRLIRRDLHLGRKKD
jgi:RNA polymerase sigma-70 factor (ECF subfamily)